MRLVTTGIALILLVGQLFACSGDPANTDPGASQADMSSNSDADGQRDADSMNPDLGTPDDTGDPLEAVEVIAANEAQTDAFATQHVCAECHADDGQSAAMRDSSGRSVAPVDLWQSTMKANSARDPFFLAVLAIERARHPELSGAIESKCLTCHAPLGAADAALSQEAPRLSDLQTDNVRGRLGADGVTCVACHAMTDEGLGEERSYSGGYTLNTMGEIYGPHQNPFTRPMEMNSGFVPVYSTHLSESAQCATCHTLFTQPIGPDGQIVEGSKFAEQTPYLEWRNSDFNTETDSPAPEAATCQGCHMPSTDEDGNLIMTELAHRPGGGSFPPASERSPYHRHIFVGGNTLLPEIFKAKRDELNVTAPAEAFDLTLRLTREQLQNRTAELEVQTLGVEGSTARFEVEVTNLTGHKFPSAYPSRRGWLRARVLDADGNVLAESGRWNAEGQIVGADGSPLAIEEPSGPIEPHHPVVTSPQNVQIYQAVLGNTELGPTVHILSAASYLKDNRLLPRGWSQTHPDAEATSPVGVESDDDFIAGSDRVLYELPVVGTPATVEVELVYQVLGARWAADLFESSAEDVQRFQQMVEDVGGLKTEPVAAGSASF